MFKRWRAFLSKQRSEPEESVAYRIAVTVLVMFALALTLHQLEWPTYSPVVLLLTPAASVFSYYRRAHSNVWLKIFLSFAMVALLLWFFARLAATLYDPRLPLAELLIWLQALHAFDLPAKKDLRYTGLVALILMAIACVLTFSTYFALFLLIFCVLFLGVMAIDFWAGNRTPGTHLQALSKEEISLDWGWLGKTVALTLPLAILGAGLIFLFMPRYQGLKLRSLPVNWNMEFNMGQVSDGEIRSLRPGDESQDTGGKPQRIEGDSYFGFDSEVNLNARGSLSDRVVMKVRTSNWQYHRAVAFSEYTGVGWKSIPWEPELKTVTAPPFRFPPVNWQDERVTIYYAETDLPNVVFAPSNPYRVYFPSNELYSVNSFEKHSKRYPNTPATLVAPVYLEEGVVYSVVNQVPAAGTRLLANLRPRQEQQLAPHLSPYLELPDTVTERTRKLAEEVTANYENDWSKATALSTFLAQNYSYDLKVDFYPEGADTADHFLFESKVGYCEQFATSLCVMARSLGLPARYVTGYLPGTFNPISGFYEIRASDAHAWTEIYLGDFGWMIFDSVPGGNPNPEVGEPKQSKWLLESLLEYLDLPPGVREALPTLLRILVGLAGFSLLMALWKGRSGSRQGSGSPLAPYLKKAERLTAQRKPGETVKNWARRLPQHPELAVLVRVYEQSFYRDKPLQPAQKVELDDLLKTLKPR
ncbi:MAG: transglutaminaseTgpA domain-containing protein [Vulcanimicrobiota bacterium]